jgi:protein-tyrosine-phosphatase
MSEEVFSIVPLASRRTSAGHELEATLSVRSAGTHALVGYPISDPMAALLKDKGLEPSRFEARRLSKQMLKEADLVLAMTRAQRGFVVELWPAAVRHTFTWREFARPLSWARSPASARWSWPSQEPRHRQLPPPPNLGTTSAPSLPTKALPQHSSDRSNRAADYRRARSHNHEPSRNIEIARQTEPNRHSQHD